MSSKFDFEKAVEDLLKGKKLTGKDRVLTPLIKELIETALEGEIESHIREEALSGRKTNRRNGYNTKIVHQIRNSLKYIYWKDRKEFIEDLRKVYQARAKEDAEFALDELEEKWSKKYTITIKSWKNKWDNLSNYFKYLPRR